MIDRSSPLANTVYAMVKPQEGEKVYAQAKDFDGNIVVIELSKAESKLTPTLSRTDRYTVRTYRFSARSGGCDQCVASKHRY